MNIVVVGLSHKTAPVELRERLAFDEAGVRSALVSAVDEDTVDEALILSTCNRVEVVASAPAGSQKGADHLAEFLRGSRGLSHAELDGYLYRHADDDAVKHVFRVTSSLDSMVVGEPQILGQVKEAYRTAVEAGTVGRALSQLMQRAISIAKRVRAQTGVSQNPVSVSSVAVELTRKVRGELATSTVLLVGAGEMAELAARRLMEAGASRLIVANRSLDRAESIAAEFGGGTVGFESLYDVLPSVDIILCSTGAPDYVIRSDRVRSSLKGRRKGPVLFVDVSVPRNIDPLVAEIEDSFLFDIDDLESVVNANLKEREREARIAEAMIEVEAQHFISHLKSLNIGPNVTEVKELLSDLALREFDRSRKRLNLSDEQEAAVRQVLIPALVNKLSHPVIVHIRAAARNGQFAEVINELRKMARLD